ncbi:unnamed protein product [Vicia faba]|uniref:Uncharacterized protein n=1 Tax=Vicia faba TaxID=3906 RepID=A0AAV0ZFM1_VICFA|nr:unnamed protein product [Vicia faba]
MHIQLYIEETFANGRKKKRNNVLNQKKGKEGRKKAIIAPHHSVDPTVHTSRSSRPPPFLQSPLPTPSAVPISMTSTSPHKSPFPLSVPEIMVLRMRIVEELSSVYSLF